MTLLLLISLFFSLNSVPVKEGELIIHIEGINKVEGNIGVLIFNKDDGFPTEAEKAIVELEVKVTSKEMKLNIDKLPFGDYAISLVHDVNSNKVLDKNFLGIPKWSNW